MAMDTNFVPLACCLLTLSFATTTPPSEEGGLNLAANLTGTVTMSTPSLNLTHTTAMGAPSNTTADGMTVFATVISTLTEGTTPFASTTQDDTALTKATATSESTNHPQTTQSTAIWTSATDGASLTTTIPSTETPTFTVLTTQATQTTVDNTSTPDTTFNSTANSSPTVSTTSDSVHNATQGLGLNNSEKNMTILFSVVLGVFAVSLVVYTFHRCKHRIQYLHQPLYNTEDTDQFVAEDDTLVISGGLYDGHPIFDNQPTATTEQSQFCLEFLHEEDERIPTF
ncbi:uncharacterized protein LOC139915276 [Centroberyx gerrardi]|uniref:uncharacterized protein n=1 Tax=Centroberyx gerrardi TaxID=166262 RepID=UPI003AAEE9D1